jgi:hypothetical protein
MHCIAYAFRKPRCINVHLQENSAPLPYPSLVGNVVIPQPKVPRRNLGHHGCCSHVIASRGALGILVVRMRLATQILSLPMIAFAITNSSHG